MDISAIFKRAWEITWKHKGLWVLGILANCSGAGGGGGSSNASRIPEYRVNGGEFSEIERWVQSIPEGVWITIGIAVVCGFLVLAFVFWVLAAIGNGGLIAGFHMAETGETVTLGSAFKQGIRYFWKLLVIQLIPGLVSMVVLVPVIIGMVLLSILTLGIGLICLIPLIFVLIPLSMVITIITLLTQIALIVEDLDIITAFKRAWEIFRSNLGRVVVMGLILGIGRFVVGLILAIPFFLIALPFVTGLIAGTDTTTVAGLSVTIGGLLLYSPVVFVASGIIRTFVTGSWTLTYRSLIATKAE